MPFAHCHRQLPPPSATSPLGKLSVSAHLSQKVSVVAAERKPVRGAMLPLTDTLMAAAPAARMSSANQSRRQHATRCLIRSGRQHATSPG